MWAFLGGLLHKTVTFITCLFMLCAPAAPLAESHLLFGSAPTALRQEINITDAYFYVGSGSYATSSEIAVVHDANYSAATAYFEVVASTTGATTASVDLVNATSSALVKSISITGGNTYTRYRSSSFTLASTTQYKVRLNNEAIGKGILSSRIVILQNGTISSTETQIEIGANETYTSTATSTFASPKYWYYNSGAWSDTPTFYAEVTYASVGISGTSTDSFTTAGATTWISPLSTTNVVVNAWGGGGAGFDGDTGGGGAGGGGGLFASSSLTIVGGTTYSLVVGAGGLASAANGATTTFATSSSGTASVSAAPGWGGKVNATAACTGTGGGGLGGKAASSTGQTIKAGGDGGAGCNGSGNNDQGGGGGGAGGPHAAGTAGSTGTGTLGGAGGQGDGSSGGAGGAGGNGGGGGAATASTLGGGGGGGGDDGSTGSIGATAGAGGGGGETGQGNGATGQITIDYRFKPATTTISLQADDGQFANWADVVQIVKQTDFAVSTSTRVRSAAFVPTNGKHYRIVFGNANAGATQAIYNAKIIADQLGGTNGAWDASQFTYDSASFLTTGQVATTLGLFVRDDGLKFYTGGFTNSTVYQYSMSPAYDLSTASYDSKSFLANSQVGAMRGLWFKSDGTKMYIEDDNSNRVFQYSLSTAWDVSSASYDTKFFDFTSQDGSPLGLSIQSDGTKVWMYGNTNTTIYQYTMSTPWDISTATYDSKSKSVSAEVAAGGGEGVYVKADGLKMFVTSNTNHSVYQYSMSSANDVSTATYDSKTKDFTAESAGTRTTFFKSDGTRIYVNATGNNRIYQYSAPSGATPTTLEPQYLLAPYKLPAGTALQTFLTLFDPAEWAGSTNKYLLDADAADNDTSVVTLKDSTGATTYATVSSPDNEATSTLTCLPAASTTWDTAATTNSGSVFGVRVLVQVGGAQTGTCAGAIVPRVIINSQTIIQGGQVIVP